MAKKIFENAYFGKPYKTRDGRKAIYCKYEMIHGVVPNSEYSVTKHLALINNMQFVNVFEDGSTVKGKEYPNDIVSEWQEEINNEKLDKLAHKFTPFELLSDYIDILHCEKASELLEKCFKAGYRKAKENGIIH